jgi:DNA polymerase III epsilon subunit family exonuclease
MFASEDSGIVAVVLGLLAIIAVIVSAVVKKLWSKDEPAPSHSVTPATASRSVSVEPAPKVQRDLSELLPAQFIVLDLETTGLSPTTDEIIEIAAIKVTLGDERHLAMQTLVKPTRRVPSKITQLTGITQAMIDADGIELDSALRQFMEFAGDLPLVTYNADFDIGFLRVAAAQCGVVLGNSYTCALKRARRAWPSLPDHKLATVASIFKLPENDQHRALGDTIRAAHVFMLATVQINQKVRWAKPDRAADHVSA